MADRSTRLARTCALAEILRDSPSPGARELFLMHPMASALVDGTQVDGNAAWQALFGTTELPAEITKACAPVLEGAPSIDVLDLAVVIGSGVLFVDVHAARLRADGAPGSAVFACCDRTDEVVARDLCVERDTIVWGGSFAGTDDYFSAAWRTFDARSTTQWLHSDDVSRYSDALAEAQSGGTSTAFDARIRGRDGHDRWYRVQVLARPGGRWFGTAIDIHEATVAEERKELLAAAQAARAEAELADRLKDEFLAVVSHELRGPVATLLLWEKVLRDGHTEPDIREQALRAIHQSAVTQSRLVGDLLDVSRATMGKLHMDLRRVDLHQLIRDALESVRPAAVAKRIELRTFWLGTPASIEGDRTRLLQVLDNVLSNAIKYTPPAGAVLISVQQHSADAIEVVVSDNGRGISPDLLPHVFEPFTQSDDFATRREGGLGLGLAIAQTIVTLHGGTMTASSRGLGHGTTITIALPASISPTDTTPTNQCSPTLQGLHVLVVDDDARVCKAIALLLRRAGAIVHAALSAAEGRVALSSLRTDVIVCDIVMPEEDGYAFVRKLRDGDGVTPAIALTAFVSDAYEVRARESGFNRHLAKPIHIERLIDCIKELHTARVGSPFP